jgi:galactonate dehydratase
MKVVKLDTWLANAGLRNYLFVELTTDNGLVGLGEASLEWQERAVLCLLEDWVADRVLATNPFDVERVIGEMIRDQYHGGPTILTAISGVEIALWDLIGKACGQPVYHLLGGRAHDRLRAYANGWYGGARTPREFADKARTPLQIGYRALKFDPFGIAWKELAAPEMQRVEAIVAAVRSTVGDEVELMVEVHGRLSPECAIEMGRRLAAYRPAWYEEPVAPNDLERLREVKAALSIPVAAGERLYSLEDFYRLTTLRACDIVQMDLVHCGGLAVGKKIAAMTQAQDLRIAPHCSVGPIALCAAVHFGWSTRNVMIQENFGDFDVPWRTDLVRGWNPVRDGKFLLPDRPGLGIELDRAVCKAHPYRPRSFPSLWDDRWIAEFTKGDPLG